MEMALIAFEAFRARTCDLKPESSNYVYRLAHGPNRERNLWEFRQFTVVGLRWARKADICKYQISRTSVIGFTSSVTKAEPGLTISCETESLSQRASPNERRKDGGRSRAARGRRRDCATRYLARNAGALSFLQEMVVWRLNYFFISSVRGFYESVNEFS